MFQARLADSSAAGNIEIRLDSPTGPLAGTLRGVNPGDGQTDTTASTTVSGATGIHDLYLVLTAGLNLEWFEFIPNNGLDPDRWYRIINQNGSSCASAAGWNAANGAVVQPWTCGRPQTNQEWQFQPATTSGFYDVVSRNAPSKVWDVVGLGTANGTRIELAGSSGGANQAWQPVPLGNGYYQLVGLQSGRCLDAGGASTGSGAELRIWDCNGSASQAWQLVQQP
jgi:hypothetical protein